MVKIENGQVYSTTGKMIRRKGSDACFKRGTVLAADTVDGFEEVSDNWAGLQEAIRAKTAEIEAHDTGEAVNSFTLQGRRMWLDNALRISITDSMRKERMAGMTSTTLWHDGIRYDLPIDTAERMLVALEVYAKQCFNTTARHKAAVAALTTVEAVAAYDFTEGYPQRLDFTL